MTWRVINYISTRANYVRRRINLLIVEFQPDRVIDERVIAKYIFPSFSVADFELLFRRCGALRQLDLTWLFVLVSFASKTFPSFILKRGKNISQEMHAFFFFLQMRAKKNYWLCNSLSKAKVRAPLDSLFQKL